jgi:iron complex transport system ATP-binding protein
MRAADRAYLLRGGTLVGEGAVQTILAREQLEALYGAPVQRIGDRDSSDSAFLPG